MEINKEYLEQKLKAEQARLEKLVKNHEGLQGMLKQIVHQIGGSQEVIKNFEQMLVDIAAKDKEPVQKEDADEQNKEEEKNKDTK